MIKIQPNVEALKRQIADPSAASAEERERIVAALQIIRDEADQATESVRLLDNDDNPSIGKLLADCR